MIEYFFLISKDFSVYSERHLISHHLLPQHPLSWKPSADGKYMMGHMILRKAGDRYPSASSTLGIKVIGGKLLEDGGRGAIIEKVKKGSPADVEGHLMAGELLLPTLSDKL